MHRKKYERSPEGLIDSMFDTLEDIRDGIILDPSIAVAVTKQSENVLRVFEFIANQKQLSAPEEKLLIEHKSDDDED